MLIKENKIQKKRKNQLSIKKISRNTELYVGKKKNETEGNLCRNSFPFEKTYYATSIFFSLIYSLFTGVFSFQMLIKNLKTNVLHEWTTLSRQLFPHSLTSLFVVKDRGFYESFLGTSPWQFLPEKTRTFLLQFSLPLSRFIFHRNSDVNQTFDCTLNNVKLRKKFTITLAFAKYCGVTYVFRKFRKNTLTVNLYSEFSCKSRFVKVDVQITSYLWKHNLSYCFLESMDSIFWQL